MGKLAVLVCVAACGDEFAGDLTPEKATTAPDGRRIVVVGEVHTVSWDSTHVVMREREGLEEPEELRGLVFAYDDIGASYPRTPDHYILIRSQLPAGISQDMPDFTPGNLAPAWGLGIHLTDIDPASPLPEIGAKLRVTGTLHQVTWNQREIKLPILDHVTIEVVSGPPPLAGPGEACTLDQDCNARLVCQRAIRTCAPPPREIYWADPWHDVNGACDTDDDCPLGQACDTTHAIPSTGTYAAHYFTAQDAGRHLCRLAPGATVASECPHIYIMRDVIGGRFVTGKEICVRAKLLASTPANDGDSHNQMKVDEPIPYPTSDIGYNLFGGTTENGPIYKDPSLPGGPIADPAADREVIAIGTYRYDPDHGWYEVHPVKAYLAPP
jgi:hypothetical protein